MSCPCHWHWLIMAPAGCIDCRRLPCRGGGGVHAHCPTAGTGPWACPAPSWLLGGAPPPPSFPTWCSWCNATKDLRLHQPAERACPPAPLSSKFLPALHSWWRPPFHCSGCGHQPGSAGGTTSGAPPNKGKWPTNHQTKTPQKLPTQYALPKEYLTKH